jgi:hypothetical protein
LHAEMPAYDKFEDPKLIDKNTDRWFGSKPSPTDT